MFIRIPGKFELNSSTSILSPSFSARTQKDFVCYDTRQAMPFTAWHSGEPNDNSGAEDCAVLRGDGNTWNDQSCTESNANNWKPCACIRDSHGGASLTSLSFGTATLNERVCLAPKWALRNLEEFGWNLNGI
jgi:hypothetical protein